MHDQPRDGRAHGTEQRSSSRARDRRYWAPAFVMTAMSTSARRRLRLPVARGADVLIWGLVACLDREMQIPVARTIHTDRSYFNLTGPR